MKTRNAALRLLGLSGALWLAALHAQAATPLPIFDSHLHYSHDAWEQLPPKAAIAILRKAGFSGYVSIEMEGAEAAETAVPKSIAVLNKAWQDAVAE